MLSSHKVNVQQKIGDFETEKQVLQGLAVDLPPFWLLGFSPPTARKPCDILMPFHALPPRGLETSHVCLWEGGTLMITGHACRWLEQKGPLGLGLWSLEHSSEGAGGRGRRESTQNRLLKGFVWMCLSLNFLFWNNFTLTKMLQISYRMPHPYQLDITSYTPCYN